jgi:hypothetical protein
LEGQAELVFGFDGRQDDSAARAARHGEVRRFDSHRSQDSDAVYVSQPKAVADVIETAAATVKAT